jgi:hypothetical protein
MPASDHMDHDSLRETVSLLLDGGRAHARARDVLAGFPKQRGERPPGFAHSAWQLLEHLRIAQHDILRFCLDPKHRSPKWPEGFWPRRAAPPSAAAWQRSARSFLAELRACQRVARDRRVDLLALLPHAEVSWAHELLLIADHNAWHLGQLMQLRRALESLPSSK